MTNLDFLRLAQARLQSVADDAARANGAMRERTLDEYRFQAGTVNGLLLACSVIEDALRKAADDTEK